MAVSASVCLGASERAIMVKSSLFDRSKLMNRKQRLTP